MHARALMAWDVPSSSSTGFVLRSPIESGEISFRGGMNAGPGRGATCAPTQADRSCDGNLPFTLNVPTRILPPIDG